MKECNLCRLDYAWDDEHEFVDLGIGPGDKNVYLCESCSTADSMKLLEEHFQLGWCGCCLHIVTEDGNIKDEDVKFCIEWAMKKEHAFCEKVGITILEMPMEVRTNHFGLGYRYSDD